MLVNKILREAVEQARAQFIKLSKNIPANPEPGVFWLMGKRSSFYKLPIICIICDEVICIGEEFAMSTKGDCVHTKCQYEELSPWPFEIEDK